MTPRVTVIVNPASGRGRGARMAEHIHRAFADLGVDDIRFTTAIGQERDLAAQALRDGATTLVACGGDGTWGNVANAIVAAGSDCRLAVVGTGTGNDFAKSLGLPAGDIDAMARLAVRGPDRRVDAGRVEDKYFINIAGFGFDIAVIEDAERIRWLKGESLYQFAALKQLFTYRGLPAAIARPGAPGERRRYMMIVIANARNFGGKFVIAPQADLADGKLDAIAILDASPLQRARLFGAVGKGTHIGHPSVVATASARYTLTFDEPPAFETDGEYNRARSNVVEVACVPGALRVVVPERSPAGA
ncbi:MAG TPA: diacylglycerol kinase family protein [Gemmatimonadaceae bacterium]|nr:diacylglycerol kinase family protein [Gemmatimonadaceae bacterium]